MAQRTVLSDVYSWMTPVPGVPGRWQHNTATRGDVIDVTDEEAKRGDGLGHLGGGDDLALADATRAAGSEQVSGLDDAVLGGFTVDQLVAHLQSYPADVDRVRGLEERRDRPRKGVMDVLEAIGAAHAAALVSNEDDLATANRNAGATSTPETPATFPTSTTNLDDLQKAAAGAASPPKA